MLILSRSCPVATLVRALFSNVCAPVTAAWAFFLISWLFSHIFSWISHHFWYFPYSLEPTGLGNFRFSLDTPNITAYCSIFKESSGIENFCSGDLHHRFYMLFRPSWCFLVHYRSLDWSIDTYGSLQTFPWEMSSIFDSATKNVPMAWLCLAWITQSSYLTFMHCVEHLLGK